MGFLRSIFLGIRKLDRRRLLVFLAVMGPGFITANADNDAGGAAHPKSIKIDKEDDWEYQAKQLFAHTRYTEPEPGKYGPSGPGAEEDSTIRLFHAPQP